ncbi:GGDEF domain-containing protein [Catellatospora vulcania]|uniref:GGDEF domain-containing protein n=1 Tax=Catellatospora vulcania TaxID=1460450 RepID=UPI0012D41FD8|nr:diguanylate cyclase [Catellatospora vulcania]
MINLFRLAYRRVAALRSPLPGALRAPLARTGLRLTVAFLAVALLLPLVGLVAIREQHAASLRAAQIEAENVAEQVAHMVTQPVGTGRALLYQQPARLQQYVSGVNRDGNRDLEIVGLDRRVLADAVPANQGRFFAEDRGGEVAATMRDGMPRAFSELNADFPSGIELVAVPMRATPHKIVGAVLLEYTPLYRKLLAAGGETRQIIVTTSLAGMGAALALGYLLSRGLVRDLRRLTRAADLLAAGDGSARALVGSRGELGELAGAFNTMADRIAVQKAALTDLAGRDPLTGLHNRRSFEERLAGALAYADRSGTPVCLLMLDLDHFKSVNDRYGHPAGDQVLRTVAALLVRELRAVDVAARLGGEEFGVLLPGIGQRDAMAAAERLRTAIARCPVVHAGATLMATTSIGVVCYPWHARTGDQLFERADDALYHAKRAGRDRVSGPPPQPAGR